ncbi:MAG: CRISPR-associated protein Csx16 [Candidatus Competibacteraceae bacterium]|nr:CRISPR-associated protein Csx16 [Candidatus Competibacteraceae bacterium]MCB1806049.1 CRISPR-associated protein Csx16 [Candidatus Competibacteraceae bacterium]MCB1815210.1 CRISPR-associated protein Csx16 [Candidatus Competibacteraceae bacterium]
MTTYFITRHSGACAWAAQQGIEIDQVIDHFEVESVQPGDIVLGTLPVHLAAQVCARGGQYLHLSVEIPPQRRGAELSAAELDAFGARLEAYQVTRLKESG